MNRPGSYLDAQEERIHALEILKEKLVTLIVDYVDYQACDHPAYLEKSEEMSKKIWEEICWRKQDYETFMWDYRKDWDLNYNDYGL